MKQIEKYVGYYLGVYVFVLAICAFFQYISICHGKSLECMVDLNKLNIIITTTAYVTTPIVAIIGFISWKEQHNAGIYSKFAIELLDGYKKLFYNLAKLTSIQNEIINCIKNKESEEKILKTINNYKQNKIKTNKIILEITRNLIFFSELTGDIKLVSDLDILVEKIHKNISFEHKDNSKNEILDNSKITEIFEKQKTELKIVMKAITKKIIPSINKHITK